MSPSTASDRVRGRPATDPRDDRQSIRYANTGEAPARPGPTSTTSGRPFPSESWWIFVPRSPRERPSPPTPSSRCHRPRRAAPAGPSGFRLRCRHRRNGGDVVALRFSSPDRNRYRTIGMRQCSAFDSLEIVALLPRRMVCWHRKRTCRGVSVGLSGGFGNGEWLWLMTFGPVCLRTSNWCCTRTGITTRR